MNWPRNSQAPASNRLAADFISALEKNFHAHGAGAIERLRKNQPWNYLQLILSVVDLEAADASANEMSDEEFDKLAEGARDAIAQIEAWKKEEMEVKETPSEQPSEASA
ncbi:MAG TPA: hypothetical protein VEU06_00660 [Micropepsaceae bacterium]|nr:hypothetical protein [Micropepsaceae bacterium]